MIRQQAEREHAPLATTDLASQQSEVVVAVAVLMEQEPPARALRGDVVERAGVFPARGPGHESTRPTLGEFAPGQGSLSPPSWTGVSVPIVQVR